MLEVGEPERWAEANFSGARMGDCRRKRRLKQIAAAMARAPGGSIPQLFESRSQIKAAYDFFDRKEAVPDRLQQGHRKRTMEAAAQCCGTVLFIEDTTQMVWPGPEAIAGLGPMGSFGKGLQGFLLQSVLVVGWSGGGVLSILGLADQQYYVRKGRPKDESKAAARTWKRREFESELWDRTLQRLGAAPKQTRWVRVADRGADIYEFLESTPRAGWGFVVRAAHDRRLVGEEGEAAGKLFDVARSARVLGGMKLELRAREGRKARTAHLSVSSAAVVIRSTPRPGYAAGALGSVACTVVRVFESKSEDGRAGDLEWILLTDAPVQTAEQALEIVRQYAARWTIEEFHKALKSGLGAERLQLETAARLFAAISIMSVAALRLIDLRERMRLEPEAPPEASGLNEVELRILRHQLKRPIQTVREVALAIGRLGGHMNRRADGMPGWQTLWRGMKRLNDLAEGYFTALRIMDSGE